MTEPTAPGPHLDLEALAELEQGTAPDSQADAMSRHVTECTKCADRLTRVRTTRALLSALPADPIPPAVADRIDAALDSAAGASRPPGVLPLRGRRAWWRSPAVAGAAAAAAVALLVAGIVVGNVASHHHRSGAGSSNGPASSTNRGSAATAAPATKVWQTGADYSPATIAALVPRLVTGTPTGGQALSQAPATGAAPAPTPAASAASGVTIAQMRTSAAAIVTCGHILAGDTTTAPLAVDFARFRGRPAVVVVLPTPGDATSLDVWVVRTVCSDQAADLYFHRIRRPG